MIGEQLHGTLLRSCGGTLERSDDLAMEDAAASVKQALVGRIPDKRVLERVKRILRILIAKQQA